jgi:RsiW-degrading membrane proteinase PrsW (M82 family)
MWAGVRKLLHCAWNPAGAGDFLAISHGLTGAYRGVVWFTFAALTWTLWNIRNKLTMEATLIGKPADTLFKMLVYMQRWRMLVKLKDRRLVDVAMGAIRRLHAELSLHVT